MKSAIKEIDIVVLNDPDSLGDTDGVDVEKSFEKYLELIEKRISKIYPNAVINVSLDGVARVGIYDDTSVPVSEIFDGLDQIKSEIRKIFESGDWVILKKKKVSE